MCRRAVCQLTSCRSANDTKCLGGARTVRGAAAEVRDLVQGDGHLAVLDHPGDIGDLRLRPPRQLHGDMVDYVAARCHVRLGDERGQTSW